MSNVLHISVRFLDPMPAFHGKRDGDEPEWPPSPLRIFQALVDAAASRWRGPQLNGDAKPALEWLQGLRPEIVAPPHHVGTPFRLSVPNNDLDSPASVWARGAEPVKPHRPVDLRTMKTVQPVHVRIDTEDALHFLYPLPSDGCPHLEVLKTAARSVTHLGWGIDMVAADAAVLSEAEAATLPGHRWRIVTTSGVPLRVPRAGTLEDLLRKHAAFLGRLSVGGFKPVPPLRCFDVVGYRRATDPALRHYTAFRLRHPFEDHSAVFSTIRANCVAAMTRHTTARLAHEQGRDGEWIDHYVHGHRTSQDESLPRFSYLPLPSIEHRGERGIALGPIRRVLVAELSDSGESHLQWARQMLPGQFLTDDKTEDRRALLVPQAPGDWVLRRYTDPSDTWSTVTPLVLPGSDEGKFAKAEKLFFKALRHAGYSPAAVAELDFRNVSFWPGGGLALDFHRPNYLKNGCWSVHHVRIRWKQAIKGPIAIGAGRHCGLGVFASLKE